MDLECQLTEVKFGDKVELDVENVYAISRKVALKNFGAFLYLVKITLGDVYSIIRNKPYKF